MPAQPPAARGPMDITDALERDGIEKSNTLHRFAFVAEDESGDAFRVEVR